MKRSKTSTTEGPTNVASVAGITGLELHVNRSGPSDSPYYFFGEHCKSPVFVKVWREGEAEYFYPKSFNNELFGLTRLGFWVSAEIEKESSWQKDFFRAGDGSLFRLGVGTLAELFLDHQYLAQKFLQR